MIYEIFNQLAQAGLTWMEWCGGVILSLYIIHLLAFVLSWCASWCYSYVHDKEKTLENWYYQFLYKHIVQENTDFENKILDWPLVDVNPQTAYRNNIKVGFKNQWYKSPSSTFWNYYYVGNDNIITKYQDEYPREIAISESCFPGVIVLLPSVLGWIFALADKFPMVFATLALLYLMLRTARGLVRTSKRVNNREERGEALEKSKE